MIFRKHLLNWCYKGKFCPPQTINDRVWQRSAWRQQRNDEIISELEKKHPKPAPIQDNILFYDTTENVLPTYFDSIDESTIFKAVCLTEGACDPSHMDADQFWLILLSPKYKKEKKDLRDQIAILARKLTSKIVDLNWFETHVTFRMIPLNKNPGVRPIGVGEVIIRVVGKVKGWVFQGDVHEVAGALQTAT